jgi:hypothetical protein
MDAEVGADTPCTIVSLTLPLLTPAGTLSGPAPTLQPRVLLHEDTTADPPDEASPPLGGAIEPLQVFNHPVPLKYSVQLVVVLNINNPAEGLIMALRCVVVMRGGKNPRLLLSNSITALAWGRDVDGVIEPSLTLLWACTLSADSKKNTELAKR